MTEATISLDVKVEILDWDPMFLGEKEEDNPPSFPTQKEAVFFWLRRADFNSLCVLTQNPHSKQWLLLSNFCPASETKDQKDAQQWKSAWWHQRDAYGQACWDEYYRGVRDAELNMVYDRQGFGEKTIQRLATAMPKWMIQNKQLKGNK